MDQTSAGKNSGGQRIFNTMTNIIRDVSNFSAIPAAYEIIESLWEM